MPLVALALVAAAPASQSPASHHAIGTFDVKVTPEAQAAGPGGGLPVARMGIAKVFSGGMTGSATGTMLSAGVPSAGNVAAYVAVDQFSGSVDGKTGGFLLLHRATMTKAGGGEMSIVIAPDSGTGALAGITGTLTIEIKDGRHHYDLAYSLPR